jgi:SAM-dependent methyltransferase
MAYSIPSKNRSRLPIAYVQKGLRARIKREHLGAFDIGALLATQVFEELDEIRIFIDRIYDVFPTQVSLTEKDIATLSAEHPEVFLSRFFWKNLLKCCIALATFSDKFHSVTDVMDLGCGPGTFSFAFLGLEGRVSIVGVDKNPNQLNLAGRLLELLPVKPDVLLQATVPDDLFKLPRLCTASYLYTEMDDPTRVAFTEMILSNQDSCFLIVDYRDNIRELQSRIGSNRKCSIADVHGSVPKNLVKYIRDNSISFGVIYVE